MMPFCIREIPKRDSTAIISFLSSVAVMRRKHRCCYYSSDNHSINFWVISSPQIEHPMVDLPGEMGMTQRQSHFLVTNVSSWWQWLMYGLKWNILSPFFAGNAKQAFSLIRIDCVYQINGWPHQPDSKFHSAFSCLARRWCKFTFG